MLIGTTDLHGDGKAMNLTTEGRWTCAKFGSWAGAMKGLMTCGRTEGWSHQQADGQTDRWTDEQTYEPGMLQVITPFGPLPKMVKKG